MPAGWHLVDEILHPIIANQGGSQFTGKMTDTMCVFVQTLCFLPFTVWFRFGLLMFNSTFSAQTGYIVP